MNREFRLDEAKSVVFLAVLLVMTVTWAVGSTGWTRGLNIVSFVGLGVVLIGMMLARSILPGLVAHLFSLVIGVGWSFWVTSRLLPAHYSWLERWQNLVFRLNYWYSQAIQGGTSYDNLMFILQMSVILWAMGYLTIWFIFRSRRVWQAIIPGGLVLLINLYYAPKDITTWFLVYLLLSLLLVIRFNLLNQESKWRAEGVFFRPDISFDFFRDGLIFSVLVIALSWITPPVVDARSLGVFDEFQGAWRDLQAEWNRLYADLNYRDVQTVGTFGQTLRLGGPRRLTDEPVMDVKVSGIGRYWRAVVYDEYTGIGWRSTDDETAAFGPRGGVSLPIFEARQPVTQTYTFYRDGGLVLYAMSNPVSLDRSARVHFNALSGDQALQTELAGWSGGEPWAEEVTYIRSNAAVDSAESYQVVSLASRATIEQLQTAGANYPTWVTERYLQLPESITERTRRLALDLTAPYDNPYDKASAIERYLRTEIRYNEKIAAPPPGVDKVDYILFTKKEAYCDYYATSMIVMLRSLGIPARLAAGFAQGEYNSELEAFHVINANAHSWVEVFFPRYGWIEFEPTAAQPTIIRPTGLENEGSFAGGAVPPGSTPGLEERPDRQENIPIDDENIVGGAPFIIGLPWFGARIAVPQAAVRGGALAVGAALLVALVGAGWWGRRQFTKPAENIPLLYRQMVRLAGWMGLAPRPWQTPYEHATLLHRRLPGYRREIDAITTEYVAETFGRPLPVGRHAARYAAVLEINSAWARLRPAMLKLAVKRRLPAWLQERLEW